MKWSPDGRLLATCGTDGACRVWHLVDKTWCCLHSLPQANQPVSIEWSPFIGMNLFFSGIHNFLCRALQQY